MTAGHRDQSALSRGGGGRDDMDSKVLSARYT